MKMMDKKRHHIIAIGSTGLTGAQSRYSPVELETLGVVFAVTKLDYFTRGAPHLAVYSDCSALGPLFAKGIDKIKNSRLQQMREKMMGYAITVYH